MLVHIAGVPNLLHLLANIPAWIFGYISIGVFATILPTIRDIPPISPATLLYAPQDSFLPLLSSPFLVTSFSTTVSRVLQVLFVYAQSRASEHSHPHDGPRPRRLITTYLMLLAVRSVLGFLLTRSVGWYLPQLLSPHALYEPVFGIGPLLVGCILFEQGPSTVSALMTGRKRRSRGTISRLGIPVLLALADGLPWTYTCAAGVSGLRALYAVSGISLSLYRRASTRTEGSTPLPQHVPATSARLEQSESVSLEYCFYPSVFGENSYYAQLPSAYPTTSPSKLNVIRISLVAMALCWLSGQTPAFFGRRISRLFASNITSKDSSHAEMPNLHIVMLTYPREKDLENDFMIENISSYVDAFDTNITINSKVTLTVYGHLGLDEKIHPSFYRAEAFFASTQAKALKPGFYMHPPTAQPPSHYAHLADALRYAYADDHEWTMIVEDDFVLCGLWGMEGILRVLNELGSTLVAGSDRRPPGGRIIDDAWNEEGTKPARWRGAFVGTGGRCEPTSRGSISYIDDSVNDSGLILHHTLLPTLVHLLEFIPALSATDVPYPQTPPDVLIQQCLSGENALCNTIVNPRPLDKPVPPPTDGGFYPSTYPALPKILPVPDLPPLLYPAAPSLLLASSRLLMGHTGNALSTGDRRYEEGKWACGWRQPMVGNRGVAVVVV